MERERPENSNNLQQIKVDLGDSVEVVAQKLFACKEKGIKAFAILNGITLNNYEFDNVKDIVSSYNDSLRKGSSTEPIINNSRDGSNTIDFQEPLFSFIDKDDEKELRTNSSTEDWKDDKHIVQYMEVGDNESIESVAQKLEICREQEIKAVAVVDGVLVDNITTNTVGEIVNSYKKQLDIDKELNSANIILERAFHYESRFGLNAREIRVGRYDRIQEVIEKLKFCKDHGINAFINFNGVILNNYDNFLFNFNDPYKIINWYHKEKKRLDDDNLGKNVEKDSNVVNNNSDTVGSSFTNGVNDNVENLTRRSVLPSKIDIGGRPYDISGPVNKFHFDNMALNSFSIPSKLDNKPLSGLKSNDSLLDTQERNRRDNPELQARLNSLEKKDNNTFNTPIKVKGRQDSLDFSADKALDEVDVSNVLINEEYTLGGDIALQQDVNNKRIKLRGITGNRLLYNSEERNMRHIDNYVMANSLLDDDDDDDENPETDGYYDGEDEELDTNDVEKAENTESDDENNDFTSLSTNGNLINKNNNKDEEDAQKKAKRTRKIIMFLIRHPHIVILGVIIIFLFLVIMLTTGDFDAPDDETRIGLYGYDYFELDNVCATVKVFNPTDGSYTAEIDFEDKYIPGVVAAEVGGFTDAPELLKQFAIAARSYALSRLDESCTIEGSARVQAFTFDEARLDNVTSEGHPIMQAARDTYGLITVKNGELFTTFYDAACYMGEDQNDYFIGYGSSTINGVWGKDPEIQKIPKSWAENKSGLMSYINASKRAGKNCYNNHGSGMSQYGSYYLATEKNYTMEQLLKYYNGEVELYSIYKTISGNFTTTTSTGATDILAMSLRDFLKSKGTSVEAFNEFILENILNAGIGTREAAVMTATSLVGGLYQYYGARLPYTYGGQHGTGDILGPNNEKLDKLPTSFYGVDPNWGSLIHNGNNKVYIYASKNWTFTRYGPDCSGFISWVLRNSGFNNSTKNTTNMSTWGTKIQFDGTELGQPGDLVWHSGHIMFIVGVDSDAKVYYIAEAADGNNGVRIRTMSFSETSEYVIDMTDWYAENRRDISRDDFITEFRNGYIDGFTGEASDIKLSVDKDAYFIGDSRTVGLCNANSICNSMQECNNSMCLAKVSTSYVWFKDQVDKIKSTKKANVVINMGVNDLVGSPNTDSIAQNYFDLYKSLAQSLRGKTVYIMSVNPVEGSTSVAMSSIRSFNSKMKSLIAKSSISNLKYLDSASSVNFVTTDGIHYNSTTYKDIYSYVMGEI